MKCYLMVRERRKQLEIVEGREVFIHLKGHPWRYRVSHWELNTCSLYDSRNTRGIDTLVSEN